MVSHTVFDYKVFPLKDVLHFVNPTLPDAYFAHDRNGQSKLDWDEALANGFRWIRTDGELVILERKSKVVHGRKFLGD